MINGYWEPLMFAVQEGKPKEWKRVVDTSLDSPEDILDPERTVALAAQITPSRHDQSPYFSGRS